MENHLCQEITLVMAYFPESIAQPSRSILHSLFCSKKAISLLKKSIGNMPDETER